jgi:hypothetical protein
VANLNNFFAAILTVYYCTFESLIGILLIQIKSQDLILINIKYLSSTPYKYINSDGFHTLTIKKSENNHFFYRTRHRGGPQK